MPMKKQYTWMLSLILASASILQAQNLITFRLDMNNYPAPFNTPEVNGTFNGWCGSNCNPMSDVNGDNIWETTIDLPAGSYEYKFALDNWTAQENLTPGSPCTVTAGVFTNRTLTVTGNEVLPTYCWESCNACAGSPAFKNVTFTVDMSDYTGPYTAVHLNGDFNNWCGICAPMTNIGGDLYQIIVPLSADSIEYKFTVDGWTDQEQFLGGEPCTRSAFGFTNRFARLLGDTTLTPVCWNSCSACQGVPTNVNVTFQVDMSQYQGAFTDVHLNGTFNNWCGDCAPMFDADGDSIYELAVSVPTAGFEYKFVVDNWTDDETLMPGMPCTQTISGYTNRFLQPTSDTTLLPVCWESCSPCGGGMMYNVTLAVDMSAECSYDSVDVVGDFNAWTMGAGAMLNDMGSGVYSGTVAMSSGTNEYKFRKWLNGQAVYESISNRSINVNADMSVPAECFNTIGTCPPQLNPTATVLGNYRVRFNWDNTGASTYNVFFRKVGDQNWTQVNSPTQQKIIRNRTPDDYEFYVAEAGGVNPSCVQTFTVNCEDYNYSVNTFQILDVTGGKAFVFGIDGGRRFWDIGLSNGNDTTWQTNKFSYRFRNLIPGDYYVYVKDAYDCYSSQVDTVTIDAVDSTTIPFLNTVVNQGGGTLVPNWTVANTTNIDRYQVRVRDVTGGGTGTLYQTYIAVGGSTTTYTINGLPPARYRIDVRPRLNGAFSNGVYSNFRERIVSANKNDGNNRIVDLSEIGGYPNPTAGMLNVAAPEGSEVMLLDMNGRIISAQKAGASEVRFDMSAMAQGVYLLRIQTDSEVYSERIVKE